MSMPLSQVEAKVARGRILVFEDDEIYSDTLGKVLRGAGFDVTVTTHFHPALQALDADPSIGLLVADIVVSSGVNGVALSRMARMRRREIKVIYLTGYDLPGVEREALGPILRKPVTEETLIAEVQRALSPA